MAEFDIELGVKIKNSDLNSIRNQLKDFAKEYNIDFELDDSGIKEEIASIKKQLDSFKKLKPADGLDKSFTELNASFERLNNSIDEIKVSLGAIDKDSGMNSMLTSINKVSDALSEVRSEFKSLSSMMDNATFNLNFDLNLGGGNSVANNAVYGERARSEILPKLKKQVSELVDFYKEQYGNVNDEFEALYKIVIGTKLNTSSFFNDFFGDDDNSVVSRMSSNSLSKQMGAYKEFINVLQEAAKLKGIDLSSVTSGWSKTADEMINDAQKILTGEQQVENSVNQLKKVFGGGFGEIDLSSVLSQLDLMVSKLDEIVVAIKNLSSSFENIDSKSSIDTMATSVSTAGSKIVEAASNVAEASAEISSDGQKVEEVAKTIKASMDGKVGDMGLTDASEEMAKAVEKMAEKASRVRDIIKTIKSDLSGGLNDDYVLYSDDLMRGEIEKYIKNVTKNGKWESDDKFLSEYKDISKSIAESIHRSVAKIIPDGMTEEKSGDVESARNEIKKIIKSFSAGEISSFAMFENMNKVLESFGYTGKSVENIGRYIYDVVDRAGISIEDFASDAQKLESSAKSVSSATKTVGNAEKSVSSGNVEDLANAADKADNAMEELANSANKADAAVDSVDSSELKNVVSDAETAGNAMNELANEAKKADEAIDSTGSSSVENVTSDAKSASSAMDELANSAKKVDDAVDATSHSDIDGVASSIDDAISSSERLANDLKEVREIVESIGKPSGLEIVSRYGATQPYIEEDGAFVGYSIANISDLRTRASGYVMQEANRQTLSYENIFSAVNEIVELDKDIAKSDPTNIREIEEIIKRREARQIELDRLIERLKTGTEPIMRGDGSGPVTRKKKVGTVDGKDVFEEEVVKELSDVQKSALYRLTERGEYWINRNDARRKDEYEQDLIKMDYDELRSVYKDIAEAEKTIASSDPYSDKAVAAKEYLKTLKAQREAIKENSWSKFSEEQQKTLMELEAHGKRTVGYAEAEASDKRRNEALKTRLKLEQDIASTQAEMVKYEENDPMRKRLETDLSYFKSARDELDKTYKWTEDQQREIGQASFKGNIENLRAEAKQESKIIADRAKEYSSLLDQIAKDENEIKKLQVTDDNENQVAGIQARLDESYARLSDLETNWKVKFDDSQLDEIKKKEKELAAKGLVIEGKVDDAKIKKSLKDIKTAYKNLTDAKIRMIGVEESDPNYSELKKHLDKAQAEYDELTGSVEKFSEEQKKAWESYQYQQDMKLADKNANFVSKQNAAESKANAKAVEESLNGIIKAQQRLSKLKIELNGLEEGSAEAEQCQKEIEEVYAEMQRLSKASNIRIDEDGKILNEKQLLNSGVLNEAQVKKYADAMLDIENASNRAANAVTKAKEDMAKEVTVGFDSNKFLKESDKIERGYAAIRDSFKSEETVKAMDRYKSAYKELCAAIESGDGDIDRIIAANKEYESALEMVENQLKLNTAAQKEADAATSLALAKEKLNLHIEAWLKNNTAATEETKNAMRELQAQIEACDKTQLNHLEAEVRNVEAAAKNLGKVGLKPLDSIKKKIKEYGAYFVASMSVYDIFQFFQRMAQEVVAVDKAMVELRRVTDLSEAQYDSLYNEMTASAREYGAALDDIINATASWARLGFDANTSKELAEITTMYQHIADIDVATANENLVTAYNGFKDQLMEQFNGDEAAAMEHVADVYNELGNKYAIDSAQIGEGVSKAASALALAGNTLEESAG